MDPNEYYEPSKAQQRQDDEYLEVADNVVFERLRQSTTEDNNERESGKAEKKTTVGKHQVVRTNRHDTRFETKRVRRQSPNEQTDSSSAAESKDLKYKQYIIDDGLDDSTARTIDFSSIAKQNRPADVLEYKRFLKVSNFSFYYQ